VSICIPGSVLKVLGLLVICLRFSQLQIPQVNPNPAIFSDFDFDQGAYGYERLRRLPFEDTDEIVPSKHLCAPRSLFEPAAPTKIVRTVVCRYEHQYHVPSCKLVCIVPVSL
jgi:hypothetical protein